MTLATESVADRVVSRFTADGEGWTISGDAARFGQLPTGGNPGGHLEAEDAGLGLVMRFEAPDAFEGIKAGYYGGVLSFDLRQNLPNLGQFGSSDVIIEGGGVTLVGLLPRGPAADWTSYSMRLNTTQGWKIGDENGPPATAAQIRTALSDIGRLSIRAEYSDQIDVVGLDNVVLRALDRPYDLYADAMRDALLATGSDLQAILDKASDFNAVEVETATTGIFTIGANIDLFANGLLSGRLLLQSPATGLLLFGGQDLRVVGTDGDDAIDGDGNALIVDGGAGNDFLSFVGEGNLLLGRDGNDTLFGADGADVLLAGAGRDVLAGGQGNDQLAGGGAADLFQFFAGTGIDRVRDFLPGIDRIEMAGYGVDELSDLTLVQAPDGVRIRASGDQIVLVGLTLDQIDDADFSFF